MVAYCESVHYKSKSIKKFASKDFADNESTGAINFVQIFYTI